MYNQTYTYSFNFFLTYCQPGPSVNLFVLYSQSDLPPLRQLCGEAPGRDGRIYSSGRDTNH